MAHWCSSLSPVFCLASEPLFCRWLTHVIPCSFIWLRSGLQLYPHSYWCPRPLQIMHPCSLRSLCASVVRHWRSSCSIIRLGEGPFVKCAAWCEEPWRSHTDLYVCSWLVDARALIAVSADGSLTLVLLAYPSLMKAYLLSVQDAWRNDVLTDPYVCSWIVDACCTDHLVC